MKKYVIAILLVGLFACGVSAKTWRVTSDSNFTRLPWICDSLASGDSIWIHYVQGGTNRDSIQIADKNNGQCLINKSNITVYHDGPDTIERKAIGGRYIWWIQADGFKMIGNPANPPVIRWAADTSQDFNYMIKIDKGYGNATIYGMKFIRHIAKGNASATSTVVLSDSAFAQRKPLTIRKCISLDSMTLISTTSGTRLGARHDAWIDSNYIDGVVGRLGLHSKFTNNYVRPYNAECTFFNDSQYIYNNFFDGTKAKTSNELISFDDNTGGSQGTIWSNNVVDSLNHVLIWDGLRNAFVDSNMVMASGTSTTIFYLHGSSVADDSAYNVRFSYNFTNTSKSGSVVMGMSRSDSTLCINNYNQGIGSYGYPANVTRAYSKGDVFTKSGSVATGWVVSDTQINISPLNQMSDTLFRYSWPKQKATNRILLDAATGAYRFPRGRLNKKIDTLNVTSSGYKIIDTLNSKYRWNDGIAGFSNAWWRGDTAKVFLYDSVAGGSWTKRDSAGMRGGNRDTLAATGLAGSTKYYTRLITVMSDNTTKDTTAIDSITTLSATKKINQAVRINKIHFYRR